jgi:paired small multidrug resistance pump
MNRSWGMVWFGGILEVFWVSGLKYADNWWMWLGTAVVIYISFELIIRATKQLPVGTVYAVFTGIGTAGTVVTEMLVFGEPFRWAKILLILLLLTGVIGLKMVTKEANKRGAEV